MAILYRESMPSEAEIHIGNDSKNELSQIQKCIAQRPNTKHIVGRLENFGGLIHFCILAKHYMNNNVFFSLPQILINQPSYLRSFIPHSYSVQMKATTIQNIDN